MRVFRFLRVLQFLSILMVLPLVHGIRIAGSDLLETEISTALVEELKTGNLEAEIELVGSMRALDALAAGEVDACIVAVPDGSQQQEVHRVYGFAFQIVAFGVNQRNPLAELDYAQLADIFKATGSTETWTVLVDAGRLRERKINLWAARSEKVIALEIFNSVVLRGSPLKGSIRYDSQSVDQLMRVTENDDAAMILIPNMTPTSGVRILAVKEDAESQSYTPTPDNVFYGDYPLRLPFKLIAGENLKHADLQTLLQAIYSDRVTRELERAHFMPLPELERQAVLSRVR